MVSLAYMYEYGKGVKKDLGEAIKWYKLAVKNGDEFSQSMLNSNKMKKFMKNK